MNKALGYVGGLAAMVGVAFTQVSCVEIKPAYTLQQIAQLPKDMYDSKAPEVSEQNFKKTIADVSANGKYVWVMMEKKYQSMECTGNREDFWLTLKDKYEDQVSGYIRVNVEDWSNDRQAAKELIGKRTDQWPKYVLVKDGKVVKDGTPNDVRIRCPPKDSFDRNSFLEYIDNNSDLRRKQ